MTVEDQREIVASEIASKSEDELFDLYRDSIRVAKHFKMIADTVAEEGYASKVVKFQVIRRSVIAQEVGKRLEE